jgi:hypothetical protein
MQAGNQTTQGFAGAGEQAPCAEKELTVTAAARLIEARRLRTVTTSRTPFRVRSGPERFPCGIGSRAFALGPSTWV